MLNHIMLNFQSIDGNPSDLVDGFSDLPFVFWHPKVVFFLQTVSVKTGKVNGEMDDSQSN